MVALAPKVPGIAQRLSSFLSSFPGTCRSGGIGRHARFKDLVGAILWKFEFSLRHHWNHSLNESWGLFLFLLEFECISSIRTMCQNLGLNIAFDSCAHLGQFPSKLLCLSIAAIGTSITKGDHNAIALYRNGHNFKSFLMSSSICGKRIRNGHHAI